MTARSALLPKTLVTSGLAVAAALMLWLTGCNTVVRDMSPQEMQRQLDQLTNTAQAEATRVAQRTEAYVSDSTTATAVKVATNDAAAFVITQAFQTQLWVDATEAAAAKTQAAEAATTRSWNDSLTTTAQWKVDGTATAQAQINATATATAQLGRDEQQNRIDQALNQVQVGAIYVAGVVGVVGIGLALLAAWQWWRVRQARRRVLVTGDGRVMYLTTQKRPLTDVFPTEARGALAWLLRLLAWALENTEVIYDPARNPGAAAVIEGGTVGAPRLADDALQGPVTARAQSIELARALASAPAARMAAAAGLAKPSGDPSPALPAGEVVDGEYRVVEAAGPVKRWIDEVKHAYLQAGDARQPDAGPV